MERQKKRESKIKMLLETTEPTKTDDAWEITAIATVLYQNRPPDPAQEVVFLLNGDEVDRVLTAEESGQAKATIILPSVGSFLLCAYVVRWSGIQRTKRISVKKAEKKSPAQLIIHRAGRSGRYLISITAISGDGKPVAGAAVRIMDPKAAKPIRDIKMDNSGSYKWSLKFDEPERIIELILLGSTFSEEIRLLGPKPQQQAW